MGNDSLACTVPTDEYVYNLDGTGVTIEREDGMTEEKGERG